MGLMRKASLGVLLVVGVTLLVGWLVPPVRGIAVVVALGMAGVGVASLWDGLFGVAKDPVRKQGASYTSTGTTKHKGDV